MIINGDLEIYGAPTLYLTIATGATLQVNGSIFYSGNITFDGRSQGYLKNSGTINGNSTILIQNNFGQDNGIAFTPTPNTGASYAVWNLGTISAQISVTFELNQAISTTAGIFDHAYGVYLDTVRNISGLKPAYAVSEELDGENIAG